MLILVMGGILMIGCVEVYDGDEDSLGASRPNYGDPFKELPTNSALIIGSRWRGYVDGFALNVQFNTTDCVFSGHDYNTNKDTLVKYTYSFKYPSLKPTLCLPVEASKAM